MTLVIYFRIIQCPQKHSPLTIEDVVDSGEGNEDIDRREIELACVYALQ
jgi:hypothetical protein